MYEFDQCFYSLRIVKNTVDHDALHWYDMFFSALVDADECGLEQACCAHHCSNNPGGYTCSCRSGFALNRNDGCSCDGECFDE